MKKIFKEIITSPIFIICFSLSIIALLINFTVYSKSDLKYTSHYYVAHCENIDDYDDIINIYIENLDKLNPKDQSYDANKKYLEDVIKIYQELKINNIDYSKAYDYGYGDPFDGNVYLIKSLSIVEIVVLINFLVVLYIVFTREFDNSRYIYVYEYTRYKTIIKKLLSIFIVSTITCFFMFGVNYLFSLHLDHDFSYVVLVQKEVSVQSISTYIFKDVFMFVLYIYAFMSILIGGISLFTRKTVFTIIAIMIIIGIVALSLLFKIPLVVYLGLANINDVIPYSYYPLTMISIVLPITLFVYGVFRFERIDL